MAGAGDFLANLGNTLNQQFLTGNEKNAAINIAQNGQYTNYGALRNISNQVDTFVDRSYTEEGAFRTDYFQTQPKNYDFLMEEPDITVLIKKRAFSSLADNFRPDLMDQFELLFYRATKILFQNKCKQISALEKLCKISQVSTDIGRLDLNLLPIIFGLTDSITQVPGALGLNSIQDSINGSLSSFANVVNRVREIIAFSQDSKYTTWLSFVPVGFLSNLGQGTGVIEFNNVMGVSTTTSIKKLGDGTFSIDFSDPYEAMLITNLDIEQAISDSINVYYNNSFIQLGQQALSETITLQTTQLNSQRAERGAAPITFMVQTEGNIIAIVQQQGLQIRFDTNDNVDPNSVAGSVEAGANGLAPTENSIFFNIVNSYLTQLSINATSRRQAIFNNQDPRLNLNKLRKKLRLHYGNKLIIQPMDTAHIYIRSKKRLDSGLVGGLQSSFGGLGFMEGLNGAVQDIDDAFSSLIDMQAEKSIFVGPDFPNWLWLILRNQFVSDIDGSHVFAGVVENASSRWNDGAFTVNVSGKDNAAFFDYGIVNFKPSVDVFNGSLYDPMTPFKLEFDSVTGVQKDQTPKLLDENVQLFQSAFVRDKNGVYAGLASTEDNFLSQDADRLKNNSVRRVFYDPDGMVYRWKEGITTLPLYGDTHEERPNTTQGPAITSNPFAGQDFMNVLSLLITGQPYNFSTFYKAAIQFDNFKYDPTTNGPPANSYFRGLQNQLKARNAIYGDFVPFKTLSMDDATFAQILNNQLNATNYDNELQTLLQQAAALQDQLAFVNNVVSTPQDADTSNALKLIGQQIQAKINNISVSLNNASNPPITIVGNDISFDYDSKGLNTGTQTNLSYESRRQLQRKTSYMTRRYAWKVRANEDQNFLIVDDTYDKDYDIQLFIKTFVQPELYKSEYVTPMQKIQDVVGITQMECFANTQGHIEIRNQKYNRVPSSVFYKMLYLKDVMGVQVYPQFLEDLYKNQLQQLFEQIEVLEDEIRLYCLALGKTSDGKAVQFVNSMDSTLSQSVHKLNGNVGGFIFLSTPPPSDGSISDISQLNLQSKPDTILSGIQTQLSSQVNTNIFSVIGQAKFLESTIPTLGNPNNPQQFQNISTILSTNSDIATYEQQLVARLQKKTGQQFNISQLFSTPSNNNSPIKTPNTVSTTDILSITNALSSFLSQRQKAIKSASNAVKNAQESVQLFGGSGGVGDQQLGNSVILPALYNTNKMPKIFESMIEDETFDDLGPGSAKRYIIRNRDVMSLEIAEHRPIYTSLEVVGTFGDQFFENTELPQDLNVFQQGNALTTVAAVDYDLWRMYGISLPSSISAPYLQNPETQCAPYAVSLLNQARKNILQGTLTVVGNEYQQPGEVIYLENRDLLFYVESVSHTFSYGNTFTTTMQITYGHNPGEYIPTWLDVIGKVLYRNKDVSLFAHKRQNNVFNNEHVGSIVGNTTSLSTSTIDDVVNGQYGPANRLALQHIIDYCSTSLSMADTTINPVLEIRVYYNSSTQFGSANSYTTSLSNTILSYLTSASNLDGNAQPNASSTQDTTRLSTFKSQISTVAVDASPTNQGENRYPSGQAFSLARKIVNASSSSAQSAPTQTQIDAAIYNYIVDCWIVFKNPNQPNSTSP